ARLMICTLMSSVVHRILTIEPERSAVGEQGRSQTACRHDFPATNAPSSDTKAGDSGASILQDGQSVCRRPTALEPDRPGAATECSLCAPTTADGPRPRAVHNGGYGYSFNRSKLGQVEQLRAGTHYPRSA